jgi:autotransporter-associated beta strand protein
MVVFPGRTIMNDTLASRSYATIDEGALWVGHCATGGLGVAAGTVVSNKLVVGGTSDSKKYQIGCGTIRQTDGEVCLMGVIGSTSLRTSSTIGWSAHGYYELTGGVTRAVGSFVVGMASPGVVAQYGGLFEHKPHPLGDSSSKPSVYFSLNANDGDATNIPSVVYVGGGTMKLGQMLLAHGKSAESIVTVAGEGACLETPARIYTGYRSGTAARVNINDGGTLATPYFAFAQNVDSKFHVNFDGGILKLMPFVKGESELTNIFGIPGGAVPQVTRVTVGPGGATIDTNGRNMSADVPLAAPTGKVVSAIPFDAEKGWTVAPYVKIVDATGDGATAFADFDSATGTLRGFRVTGGGWNYSCPTAQVVVCKTVVREIACTLADAPATGRFVKTGDGTLLLNAVNTYGGDTVVSNGTLKAACAGALPTGSRIVLSGGKVEVSAGVAFPSELTVDMVLDENEVYVLSDNFTGDTVPVISGLPQGWVARVRGGRLILQRMRGFTLIVM